MPTIRLLQHNLNVSATSSLLSNRKYKYQIAHKHNAGRGSNNLTVRLRNVISASLNAVMYCKGVYERLRTPTSNVGESGMSTHPPQHKWNENHLLWWYSWVSHCTFNRHEYGHDSSSNEPPDFLPKGLSIVTLNLGKVDHLELFCLDH